MLGAPYDYWGKRQFVNVILKKKLSISFYDRALIKNSRKIKAYAIILNTNVSCRKDMVNRMFTQTYMFT